MSTEKSVTLLVAVSTFVTLFLGYVNGTVDTDNINLIATEIELAQENIDYLLTERLIPLEKQDTELRLAKEEAIDDLISEKQSTLNALALHNRASLSLLTSLVILQLLTVLTALVKTGRSRIVLTALGSIIVMLTTTYAIVLMIV